jgi:type IV pilus assembly protein PilO
MTTATRTRVNLSESFTGITEKSRALMTQLNLYYAGVALLGLLNLFLLAQIFLGWRSISGNDARALDQQTVALKAAEIATKPLQGLDGKLSLSTKQADEFYAKRLPVASSEINAELGAIAKQHGVRLRGVQYGYAPVLDGAAGALVETHMDANLSGDYRPLVLFINSLERDKMFFVITGVSLTSQSTGMVGLRLKLTSYLRPPANAAEAARVEASQNAAPAAAEGEKGGATQ